MPTAHSPAPPEGGRSARSRRKIIDAATETFLRKGYAGTSMDEIAASAAVSKQTVYKHFADKETLFVQITRAMSQRADEATQRAVLALGDLDDPRPGLVDLGQRFLTVVVRPQALLLRRLVIAEAERFPEIGRAFWESGFERVIGHLSSGFARLTDRGLLRTPDPVAAAHHFAGLVLWIPMNRAMFCGDASAPGPDEIDRLATAAADAFLAAYGPPPGRTG
ncbi:TetR/AcrR family transcriptional regulator [Actinomadura flavalba]|uniref:TetR/AcrR family transcriptional regulator n=1 Tax=Actinomadura flavalba TaxID=1120938 RepID=UPI00036B1674|nr:TetR/AcrR family transcriptional regulator [Actinomadura flavalba]